MFTALALVIQAAIWLFVLAVIIVGVKAGWDKLTGKGSTNEPPASPSGDAAPPRTPPTGPA